MGSSEEQNETKMLFSFFLEGVGDELMWMKGEKGVKDQALLVLRKYAQPFEMGK